MKKSSTIRLFASVAMLAVITPVLAEEQPKPEADMEDIIIVSSRESRQVQEVSGKAIDAEAAGISPLKVLALLPSVNFQSADPFGSYEWSARITIRGFNQNRLGFTLDDITLGDMSYGNNNGLHISRATISENLSRTIVAQGAGALGTASTSNLGGTVQFVTQDPRDSFGARGSVSYGSENSWRIFSRVDSGDLGSGTRFFVSGAYQDAGKWKGEGVQQHKQINARVTQDIGSGKLTAFVNWSDRREQDYQDLSLEMIQRLGYDWDNFNPDWATAVRVAQVRSNLATPAGGTLPFPTAGTSYPAPITSADDSYFDASGLRKDWLYGARLDYEINDAIKVKLVGYGHNNEGVGTWFTPYQASPSGLPISVRTTEYEISRFGGIGDVVAKYDNIELNAGLWFEKNDFKQARRFYGLDNTLAGPSRSALDFPTNPFRTQWYYDFDTNTRQFHIQATYRTDQFSVNAGFKGVRVTNKVAPLGGDSVINFSQFGAPEIKAEKNFLPQVGATFTLDDQNQFFASYSKNMRAFVSSATSGPFSTSADGFRRIRGTLKPETTDTFEAGWRFNYGIVSGVFGLYQVDFKDRLLGVATPGVAGIIGNPVAIQNVGGVRSRGVEALVTGSFADHWSATASYSYNDNKYKDDVIDGLGNRVATGGKRVIDSPEHLFKAEIGYDDALRFFKADVNYMSKRFFTYLNDQSVPGRALVNATLGVRIGGLLGYDPKNLAIQLNVSNLFDKDYVSTLESNGTGNSGDNQTLLAGSPRQIFVSLRAEF